MNVVDFPVVLFTTWFILLPFLSTATSARTVISSPAFTSTAEDPNILVPRLRSFESGLTSAAFWKLLPIAPVASPKPTLAPAPKTKPVPSWLPNSDKVKSFSSSKAQSTIYSSELPIIPSKEPSTSSPVTLEAVVWSIISPVLLATTVPTWLFNTAPEAKEPTLFATPPDKPVIPPTKPSFSISPFA